MIPCEEYVRIVLGLKSDLRKLKASLEETDVSESFSRKTRTIISVMERDVKRLEDDLKVSGVV